jgi:hypothetical protein
MALYLRRASDEFPRAHWDTSNEHLVIMSGENVVGSLKKVGSGASGERWQWSITAIVEAATGWAETREEAQAQFAAARRPWLGRTRFARVPLGCSRRGPRRDTCTYGLSSALLLGVCADLVCRARAHNRAF